MTTKPKLPVELSSTNNFAVIYYILHGLFCWLVPAFLAWYIFDAKLMTPAMSTILSVPLLVISALGLFFLATLGHEGFHGNLSTNRKFSMALGAVISSIPPGFFSTGYTILHWQHHKFTNTEKDPDYQIFSNYNNFFTRLVFGTTEVLKRCYVGAISVLFGKNDIEELKYPFERGFTSFVILLNLTFIAVAIGIYSYIAMIDLVVFMIFIAIPTFLANFYWSMCPIIEHAETGLNDGNNTRTYTSKFFSIVLLGYNYHICHHLYPNVQTHKLPKVYKFLEESGYKLNRENEASGLLAPFKIGLSKKLHYSQY